MAPKPEPSITVSVELAPEVFYRQYADRLEEALKMHIPDVEISTEYGRQGSYEVTVNNRLVYSKLKRGFFPKRKEVVDYCDMVVKDGKDPDEIPQFDCVFCTVL